MQKQDYVFRLHEHADYGWQPRKSPRDFISILTNLTAIKIRATYTPQGIGFLDDVKLETAQRGIAGKQALWIEHCKCPTGNYFKNNFKIEKNNYVGMLNNCLLILFLRIRRSILRIVRSWL